jgi:hypothetical protein
MDYRYLGSIFRGPLTGVTIGYYPMWGAESRGGARAEEHRGAAPGRGGGSVIEGPSPLNVLKDTYDHNFFF